MDIQRVNTYTDSRFPQDVLYQHGAFLVDGRPWAFRVISDHEAVVRAEDLSEAALMEVIENFRFYAGHITSSMMKRGTVSCACRLWSGGRWRSTAYSPPSSPWTGRSARLWGISSGPPLMSWFR